MSGVKIIVRNDAGNLVQLADYIDRTGWEVTQNAEEGSVGISTLYLDDLDQSIWTTLGYNVGGRRQIRLVDYDSGKIVHFGYTSRRAIRRRFDVYGNSLGRAWSIEIWDPNSYLQRRILTHHGAKRPRETDVERIQWLITAAEWDIIGDFMISTNAPNTMSKSDYRGQTVGDVVADCAQQARKNYWVDIVDQGIGDRLTFTYGREPDYDSTLSISNDLADLSVSALSTDATTLIYPPSDETEYQMDPTRVYSGVYGTWEKGAVYRHRQTTATQFERWDTAMQWPNIHEKDRAADRAEKMLDRLADEDERIETAVIIPAARAHLLRAGMRIPVKLTHIPRLTSFTDCRVLSRGLSPIGDGTRYRIPLVLEPIGTSTSLTCSTALTNANAAIVSTTDTTGASSADIAPEAGEDSAIIIGFLARQRLTPDGHAAHLGGTATEVYADQTLGSDSTGPWEHPTWAIGYDNVVAAAGDYTASATYTGHGTNGIAWVMVSFQTAATTPVQEDHDKSPAGSSGASITFGSPVTAGNMILMVVTVRDKTPYAVTDLLPATGWTEVAVASAVQFGISDSIGIYARCVSAGDTDTYGVSHASSKSHSVTAMEWDVS